MIRKSFSSLSLLSLFSLSLCMYMRIARPHTFVYTWLSVCTHIVPFCFLSKLLITLYNFADLITLIKPWTFDLREIFLIYFICISFCSLFVFHSTSLFSMYKYLFAYSLYKCKMIWVDECISFCRSLVFFF